MHLNSVFFSSILFQVNLRNQTGAGGASNDFRSSDDE